MSPGASPGGSGIKDRPTNARGMGSIPESGIFPIEGNGNALRYSSLRCLADYSPWDRRARHNLMTKQIQCLQDDFE